MSIYLTGSDYEAIVNFVNDHEKLYDKTNNMFNNMTRKDYL